MAQLMALKLRMLISLLPATKYAVFSAISDVAKMENKDA